ncbi:MAG: hypothetical protein H6604_02575 [Flavobacteriales bacterium]|nr:hypothetical protein [Flavobacteriales bacterium]
MPEYSFQLSKKAEKFLDKLSDHIANPILEAIGNLKYNPALQRVNKQRVAPQMSLTLR